MRTSLGDKWLRGEVFLAFEPPWETMEPLPPSTPWGAEPNTGEEDSRVTPMRPGLSSGYSAAGIRDLNCTTSSRAPGRDTALLSVARREEIVNLRRYMAKLVEELGPLNTDTKAGCYVARKGYFRGLSAMYGRWVFNQKIAEGQKLDPLLPFDAPVDTLQLPKELMEAGLGHQDADRVSSLLSTESRKAAERMAALAAAQPPPNDDLRAVERSSGTDRSGLLYLSFGGASAAITQAHYNKLCSLWDRKHGIENKAAGWQQGRQGDRWRGGRGGRGGAAGSSSRRDEDIFCLLQRYEALNGESPGFQMAIPEEVFDVLKQNWGVSHECFASPLNCYFPDFCSLFSDTDPCFGSRGSFFEFNPTEGSFESNPPFVEDTMAKGAKHIIKLLGDTAKPLSFVIIVPGWEDGCESYELVTRSPFLRHHLTLGKAEHFYKNGMQHSVLGRGVYQRSSCSTFVFFMQNDPGAAKWPVAPGVAKMHELVDAFCRKPRERPRQGHQAAIAGGGAAAVPSSKGPRW